MSELAKRNNGAFCIPRRLWDDERYDIIVEQQEREFGPMRWSPLAGGMGDMFAPKDYTSLRAKGVRSELG